MENIAEKLIVTSVKYQKYDKEKVSIFVNGSYYDSIHDMIYASSNIKIGEELNINEFNQLKVSSEGRLAFNRAIKYMGYRMRSKREVTDYLNKKGFDEEVIEIAVRRLIDFKYLNDRMFAISFIRDSQKLKRHGSIRIAYELKKKGVLSNIIDETIEKEYDKELEYENIIRLAQKLQKKHRKVEDEYKRNAKITNSLYKKGYSYDMINIAISETSNNNNEAYDYE